MDGRGLMNYGEKQKKVKSSATSTRTQSYWSKTMDEAEYEDLLEEARLMTEPEDDESAFSDNPDWYLRMCEDDRKGYADYE